MKKLINILLVENDPLDQVEVQRTFDKKEILYKMKIAKNGEDALRLLMEKESPTFSGKPDLILLDLNMPKMNGMEFLRALRAYEEWQDVKVFILTTSEDTSEKSEAMRLGASGFIVKPLKLSNPTSIDGFNLMIDLINFQN